MTDRYWFPSSLNTGWLLMVVFVVVLGLSACSGPSAPIPSEVGNPERGKEIFETGADVLGEPCKACHSLDGSVRSGTLAGPTIVGISERASERVPELTAVEYLRESILDPSAFLVNGYDDKMEKGYQYLLSEQDINALIAFMLTQ